MPWKKNLYGKRNWRIRLTTVYGNTFVANSLSHFGRIMHVTDDSARAYLTGEYVTRDCKPKIMTPETYRELGYQPYLDKKLVHYEVLALPASVKEETRQRVLVLQEYRNEMWKRKYEQKPLLFAKTAENTSQGE